MKILVTGSAGLIGSEVCRFFHQQGAHIHGVDNNQRAVFFGPQGDTLLNRRRRFNEGGRVTEYSAVKKGLNRVVDFFIRALFHHSFNDTTNVFTAIPSTWYSRCHVFANLKIQPIKCIGDANPNDVFTAPPIALAG